MIYETKSDLSPDALADMDANRIKSLDEAGINENDVLQKARDNLQIWDSYFSENMTRGKDDMNFVIRDQWTAVERSEFNRLFKPAMTFNKLYDVTKKITGEQRKNKPDLIVRSLTGQSSQEQLTLRGDLVRTISYRSQNDLVYQTAFRSALMMGWGAFQISIDYESPTSFNQDVIFNIIPDVTRTSFDPTALKPHKGDGNYCARSYIFSKEEFDATYPYILNPCSYQDPRTLLDFQWETRDTIVVCDYYQKEWYSTMVYKLSNGQAVTMEQWEDMQKKFKIQKEIAKETKVVSSMILDQIPKIIAERQTQNYRIMHYRLIKDKIIDFSEWPSKNLPIIFVDGASEFIDGRQYTRSFIHEAKDSQKFINYVGSEIAAEVKNRRREQWIGTPDNIIGNEQMWRNPELQNGILIARPDPKTGQMPTKMPAWDISQGLLAQYQRGTQDIREILGFSEAEQQSRDISGKAKQERRLEGSMSAAVWFDNLNQAIEQAGRVVLDLLPHVYGQDERVVNVNKKNGNSEQMVLNQRNNDGTISNVLEDGDYDIEIDTGPSFAVQKEVALEMFTQTIQAFPQAFPLIGDLWAANLDLEMMPQIKERFKTLVPPQVLAQEEGKQLPPQPPNPQEQMMAMQQKLAESQLKEREQELQIRAQKQQLAQAQLALDAEKLQDEIRQNKLGMALDMHKSNQDHKVEIAKILADLHKARTANERPNNQ